MGQNSNEVNNSEWEVQSNKCETYTQTNINPESIQITKKLTEKVNNTIMVDDSSNKQNKSELKTDNNADTNTIIKNEQTSFANIENENVVDIDYANINKAKEQEKIKEWLQNLTKKLDFLHVQSPTELVVDDLIQKDTLKRICDPHGLLQYDQVQQVKNSITEQTVNKIHGKCAVTLHNGDECEGNWRQGKRMGKGTIIRPSLEKLGVSHISGNYDNGVLAGLSRVTMLDNSILEGWFQHGYLHGPARATYRNGQLAWVGWFSGGLAVGTCWQCVSGDSWLVGKVDNYGRFTGDHIAFLYPDLSTALLGTWREGQLISAVPAVVQAARVVDGVMELEFKKTGGPVYKRWISHKQDITCPPHQGDVYERSKVEVRTSQVEGAGEGLYARVDMEPDIIVAYYNGLRLKPGEGSLDEDTGYAIFIDWARTWQEKQNTEHMDIPARYQSIVDYSATLGHKVNHSFDPNLVFDVAEHPCYGRIPALRTLREVAAGEELCAHYTMDMEDAHDWYREAWQVYSTGGHQIQTRDTVEEATDNIGELGKEAGDNIGDHRQEGRDNIGEYEMVTKYSTSEHQMEEVDNTGELEEKNNMGQYIEDGTENTEELQIEERKRKEIDNVGDYQRERDTREYLMEGKENTRELQIEKIKCTGEHLIEKRNNPGGQQIEEGGEMEECQNEKMDITRDCLVEERDTIGAHQVEGSDHSSLGA